MKVDAVDGAMPRALFGVLGVGTEFLAADRTSCDKRRQRLRCCPTTEVHFAVGIETRLVDFGRIDAVQPVLGAVDPEPIRIIGPGETRMEGGDCKRDQQETHGEEYSQF